MKRSPSLVILGIAITLTAGCYNKQPESSEMEGKPIPSLNLLLMDSVTKINTTHVSRGKPTVILFISPYCPYCKALTKEIISDIESLKKIQFLIITSMPFHLLKQYALNYQLRDYSNIIVAQDYNFNFGNFFKIKTVPYIAVYNKNSVLEKVLVGNVKTNQIKHFALN